MLQSYYSCVSLNVEMKRPKLFSKVIVLVYVFFLRLR